MVSLRGTLITVGALLVIAALFFMVWGIVEVGQGDKGTWEIWPFYLIHGGISLVALVLFSVANKGRTPPAATEGGGGGKI